MISILRDFTKSWVFTLLMGLLIASFAVFGLRDVFTKVGSDNVVTAGKRVVSVAQFKQMYDNYKQQYASEHNGQSFTNEEFVKGGNHEIMLSQLADKTALSAWFDSVGIKPSAKLIVDRISQTPYFFNSATGRFDKDTYRRVLAQQMRIDDKTFEHDLSDDIAAAQYGNAAIGGLKTPRIYAAAAAAFNMQTRDFSYFMLSPASVPAIAPPSDADIATFYKAHLSALTIPEMRQASLIMISSGQIAPTIKVSDDELKKAYDLRIDSLKTPETRTFIQISAPDMNAASAISAALKSGQSPDAAARAHKGTVISYADKPMSAVPDPKIGAAAFALQTGEVSGALKGDLGVAVIKMGAIKTGTTPSLDSLKAQLTDEIRKDRADTELNKVSHALADELQAGNDFDATAKKLGLKTVELLPMSAEGRTTNPSFDPNKFPGLVKTIFDLQAGGTSDVEEMGKGVYYVVKLRHLQPAGAPPIDKIKGELTQYWMQDKVATALQDKATQVMNLLGKGEPMAKLAAEAKAELKTVPNLDRGTASQKMGEQVTSRIFYVKPGESFQMAVDPGHIAIGRVDAIHQASPIAVNGASSSVAPQLSQSVAKDMFGLTQAAARKTIKTATYPALALRALDVAPPDADANASKKATP